MSLLEKAKNLGKKPKSPKPPKSKPQKPKTPSAGKKKPQSKEVTKLRDRLRRAERIIAKTETFLKQLQRWERFTDPKYTRTHTVNDIRGDIDDFNDS